jgi:hypothetical protein
LYLENPKKITPDVNVTTEEIRDVLVFDVLKRKVFDDEEAEEARKKINKVFKSSSKKDTPPMVQPTAPKVHPTIPETPPVI